MKFAHPITLRLATAAEANTAFQRSLRCSHGRRGQLEIRRHSSPMMEYLVRPAPSVNGLVGFFEETDRILNSALNSPISRPCFPHARGAARALQRPERYSIQEDEDRFQLTFEVPGVKPSDMKISLEEEPRIVRIRGVREEKRGGMSYETNFEKTLVLGKSIDTSLLSANLSNGVLTIDAPKKPKAEPVIIDIPIQTESPSDQSQLIVKDKINEALENDSPEVKLSTSAENEDDLIDLDKEKDTNGEENNSPEMKLSTPEAKNEDDWIDLDKKKYTNDSDE